MSSTRSKPRLSSEDSWHIVEGPNTLRHLLQAPGKSRVHGILLEIEMPISIILELDNEAVGIGGLITPVVSEDNHGLCTPSACYHSNKSAMLSEQVTNPVKGGRRNKKQGEGSP